MEIVPQEFVLVNGEQIVTDSRRVAQHFGMPHKNVLRAIDRVECSEKFNRLNFEPIEYLDGRGRAQRAVRMSKDGFMFLVMGFTGAKAAAIKEAFIDAFNRMAEFIRVQLAGAWEAWNAANQQHLADKRHVSHCAKDMRRWQDVKPAQLALLERLHPQIPLFPALT